MAICLEPFATDTTLPDADKVDLRGYARRILEMFVTMKVVKLVVAGFDQKAWCVVAIPGHMPDQSPKFWSREGRQNDFWGISTENVQHLAFDTE